MIKRIVKLTFQPDRVPEFMAIFQASCQKIRASAGCKHMELLQDAAAPNVMFTLSIWETEADLDMYRKSELFKTVWTQTKALFADKPAAWSTLVVG